MLTGRVPPSDNGRRDRTNAENIMYMSKNIKS